MPGVGAVNFETMPVSGMSAEFTPVKRLDGFLVGAVIGASLAASTAAHIDLSAIRDQLAPTGRPRPLAPPPGRRRAATALADALLEELLAGGVDLHRLSHRWCDWWREDGCDTDMLLAQALEHLRDFDAPVAQLPVPGAAVLSVVLPAALASASPRAMVAGAFHVARLLDPSEESGLAAVAIVVASAALLEGRRDVIPEVLAFMRANNAPEPMQEAVRDLPRHARRVPPVPRGQATAIEALCWLLWMVEYQPRAVEALTMMVLAGGVAPALGAVLGAMLGARDGRAEWPAEWIDGAGEEVALRAALARRVAAG